MTFVCVTGCDKTNNFENLRFFHISHIMVKKLNFEFSIFKIIEWYVDGKLALGILRANTRYNTFNYLKS